MNIPFRRPDSFRKSHLAGFVLVLLGALATYGCSSAPTVAIETQRNTLVNGTGLRCKYLVQGEKPQDFELQLNIGMASECDPERPFAITPFVSDSTSTRGVVFCCSKERIKETDIKPEPISSAPSPEAEKPSAAPTPSPAPSPVITPVPNVSPAPSPAPEAADPKKDSP